MKIVMTRRSRANAPLISFRLQTRDENNRQKFPINEVTNYKFEHNDL